MSYLRDERQKHTHHDNGNVRLGKALFAWVGIHVAVYDGLIVPSARGCVSHGVHGNVSGLG